MVSQEIKVTNPRGVHARPSLKIVQSSLEFKSKIFIEKGKIKISASSMISLLSLTISHGDKLTIIADGPDEEEALAFIVDIFERNFDEA